MGIHECSGRHEEFVWWSDGPVLAGLVRWPTCQVAWRLEAFAQLCKTFAMSKRTTITTTWACPATQTSAAARTVICVKATFPMSERSSSHFLTVIETTGCKARCAADRVSQLCKRRQRKASAKPWQSDRCVDDDWIDSANFSCKCGTALQRCSGVSEQNTHDVARCRV